LEPLKIRISGYGGQGIVLAGVIVGHAAVLEGKNAVQTQSYGSESRGGACKADVIISDEEIYEIEPTSFDCLVAMSQAAFKKYVPRLEPGGKLIIEEGIEAGNSESYEKHTVAATEIAKEHFGRKIMGNMVVLGFLSAVLGLPSRDSMVESIRENVPKETEQDNTKAFELGYEEGLKRNRRE
jgi:2-oxoglutarate ferredoxin oxidoreductase subunit gamma